MRVWILGFFLAIVGIVLVVALWLLGYHLSGKWAFNHWKSERIAMGDRFDWKNLMPPPVPPNQNFAETALVRGAIIDKEQADDRFKSLDIPKNVEAKLGNWMEGRRDDLGTLGQAYGVEDLGTVFKNLEPIIKELDQASLRAGSRFPIDYEEGQYPAIVGFRGAIRTLRLKALMNLRAGHPELALQDLQTCFRVADHLKNEPHLISALLRTAIVGISMQVVWEGTEDHLWTGAQLTAIQADLEKFDLLAMSRLTWQAERQGAIDSWSATAENRPAPKYWAEPNARRTHLGTLGRGWFYRNLLVHCQFVSSMVDSQDPVAHRVYPDRLLDPMSWLKGMRFRKDLIMAQIALPALTEQVIQFARRQALIDEGVVVCALERYRLERGHYPERLEDLIPVHLRILPHDLVTGRPLRYQRHEDRFILYQVGWDGKDDGGKVVWTGEGDKRTIDASKGDWSWPHSQK